ncbi:MAG TPA: MTAP family purine nucleoside phosphorylase [Solirubrobacterales bacterium]|nr:MTAP family purine nucleoside phosphorylase [Solirubrobacterales bacterium]
MGRVAVILGSNGLGPGGEDLAATAAERGALVLQRHVGPGGAYTLPHQIDYAASLRGLAEQGCDRVLAVGSVGSLRAELPVGSLVCPHDFIALHLGLTTLSDVRAHRPPGFDAEWRSRFLAACLAGGAPPVQGDGVYWQAIGPRFETPAEIRLMAAHADVVGMTIASECIVAGELGLRYAAICAVDNLANGLGSEPLGIEGLERVRATNVALLRDLLDVTLPHLSDG